MDTNFSELDEELSQISDEEETPLPEIGSKNVIKNLFKKYFRIFKKGGTDFRGILYAAPECPPYTGAIEYKSPQDYVTAFRSQYPDKDIRILVPVFKKTSEMEKTSVGFEFFAQNKMNKAQVYKFPKNADNVTVYGLYSPLFDEIKEQSEFLNIEYLAPFLRCARLAVKRFAKHENFRPDIVHSDNLPFFCGSEFEYEINFPAGVLVHSEDFGFEENLSEPFRTVINIADKAGMKRICRDKTVRENLAMLFKFDPKDKSKIRKCLKILYKNYSKFRQYVDKNALTEENKIFEQLNECVLKMFPRIFNEGVYNPYIISVKKASLWSAGSKTYYNEIVNETAKGGIYEVLSALKSSGSYLTEGCTLKETRIHQDFDKETFRIFRGINKNYLLREFSYDRVKTNFTDMALFRNENYLIRGYLDNFYSSPLLFGTYSAKIFHRGVDIAFNTVLRLFEQNKNCQVIINIPNGYKNNFIKSWIDFFEQSTSFAGRWVFIDGEINLEQFCSSSDIIMSTERSLISGNILYTAMKYGCIPVVVKNGFYNDTVIDIFENIKSGFGFKTSVPFIEKDDVLKEYYNTMLKALNFYSNNPSGWNLLIKNSMEYDTSWNFKTLERYNILYELIR